MRRFVREVRHGTQLSSEISRFVETEDVENRLHALLLVKFGLAQYAKCQPRTRRIAHLRSTLTFLENFSSLTGADPNLSLLFQVTNRYGSIQKYYEDGDAPRRGVQRLVELGYNTDHLVFGTEEILWGVETASQKSRPAWTAISSSSASELIFMLCERMATKMLEFVSSANFFRSWKAVKSHCFRPAT
jgi:hypothetical protein